MQLKGERIDLTSCNFGGKRPKRTRLLTNAKGLAWMAGPCSQTHPPRHFQNLHAPWGRKKGGGFCTAEEAEYPPELCQTILRQVFGLQEDSPEHPATQPAAEAAEQTTSQPPRNCKRQAGHQTEASLRVKALRAAGAGRQPRGLNRLRVVPEHRERRILTLFSPEALLKARTWAAARGRKNTAEVELEGQTFPPSSQLLAADDRTLGGVGGADAAETEKLLAAGPVTVVVGIPFTPLQYIDALKAAVHPFSGGYPLRQRTADCIETVLRLGPEGVRKHRNRTMSRWHELAQSLSAEEAALHKRLHPDVQAVVKGKRLLLLQRILREICYEDVDAATSMTTGFPVVGVLPDSLAFPPRHTAARDSVRELLEHAPDAQKAVAAGRPSDLELDRELFETTEREARETGLLRSTTPAELGKRYGPRWVPTRRFGIRQGKKLRPIDDFSAQGHNATVEPRSR